MTPSHLARHAFGVVALAAMGHALAGPIGTPWYSIELVPWGPNSQVPAGPNVVLVSTHDAIGGEMAGEIPLGPYVLPPAQAKLSAAVINDGQTFWAQASTPLAKTLPIPAGSPIGGTATVDVVHKFRKDSADARMDFTYSQGLLELFRDIELGRSCDDCIHAEVRWDAEVYLTSDPGNVLWHQGQQAMLWDDTGVLSFDAFGTGSALNPLWQWDCAPCGGPSFRLGQASLQAPYTGSVDLSGIPFLAGLPTPSQPEFAVHYTLTAIAYDEGTHSGASASARDPLGSNSGVSFAIAGLTPSTNAVGVVPEPGTWALMLAGLAVLCRLASGRRAAG